MGEIKRDFQDTDYILRLFGEKVSAARKAYRIYVKKGIAQGRRPELVGGGLIRSAGGWSVIKAMRRGMERIKGDERILGEGQFVETVLKAAQENLDRKSHLEAKGYSFDWLVGRLRGRTNVEH